MDGSLYGGYPAFDRMVRETFGELVGSTRARRLRLAFVQDPTGAGAAVIAAVAARRRG